MLSKKQDENKDATRNVEARMAASLDMSSPDQGIYRYADDDEIRDPEPEQGMKALSQGVTQLFKIYKTKLEWVLVNDLPVLLIKDLKYR